jgi:hypothetical protein
MVVAIMKLLVLSAVAMMMSGCSAASGGPEVLYGDERVEFAADGSAVLDFVLNDVALVEYTVETRNDDTFTVCIIDGSERTYWLDGNAVETYVCDEDATFAGQSIELAAGSYARGFYCGNVFENCVLAVSMVIEGL